MERQERLSLRHNNMRFLGYCVIFFAAALIFAAVAVPVMGQSTHTPNIDFTEPNHWAWNDVVGWIDFCFAATPGVGPCNANAVEVPSGNPPDVRLKGYALSTVGYFVMSCDVTPNLPNPNICAGSAGNWGVTRNSNTFDGWAWNDVVGWVSFNCSNTGTCASSSYNVQINATSGELSGWAWNDVIGWISFNCVNSGTNGCGPPPNGVDYKVKIQGGSQPSSSGNLTSSIFDTCPSGTNCGAAFNTIMWREENIGGGTVEFQIASSDSPAGPWEFKGQLGTNDWYLALVNTPVNITRAHHNNKRYVRYKTRLNRGTASPVVRDIIINWSP